MSEDRLKYLVYRCLKCRSLLTKLDILEAWNKSEEEGVHYPICKCGGRQISPTNATPQEEKKYCGLWQKIRYYILQRDDDGTKMWKLYDKCVKGKGYGKEYKP